MTIECITTPTRANETAYFAHTENRIIEDFRKMLTNLAHVVEIDGDLADSASWDPAYSINLENSTDAWEALSASANLVAEAKPLSQTDNDLQRLGIVVAMMCDMRDIVDRISVVDRTLSAGPAFFGASGCAITASLLKRCRTLLVELCEQARADIASAFSRGKITA